MNLKQIEQEIAKIENKLNDPDLCKGLWNIQGHNSKKWADNLQAKWGTELIAVTQNKNGFWGPKFRLSISKMKEYFGYESDAIVGFNLK